jgi:hypothetical protein
MADEFDPDKITNLSQVREQRDLEEKYVDFMSSLREKVGKRKKLGDAHSWKYEIGDRVVTRHTAKLPNPTPWKITERVIREKGLLEGSRPREGKNITGRDVPYYMVSRIEDVGTPEEGEVFSSLPEWSIQSKFGLEGLVPDEPRPKDQPRLPPLLEGPPEEPGKKPSKGRVMRGIGSLMRGRMFPIIRAAQAGWETLSPEARAEIEDYLKRPAHELFGMDKPGIEYFKELLGISPEDLGETIPLPGPEPSHGVLGKPLYHASTKQDKTLATLRPREGAIWFAVDIADAAEIIGTKGGPSSIVAVRLSQDGRVLDPENGNDRAIILEAMARVESAPLEEVKTRFERNIAEGESWEDIDNQYLLNALRNDGYDAVMATEGGGQTVAVLNKSAIQEIPVGKVVPGKAAGGFIDKPLYDDRRMIG